MFGLKWKSRLDGSSPFSFDEPEPDVTAAPPGYDRPPARPGTPGRARISTLPTGGTPMGPPGGGRAIVRNIDGDGWPDRLCVLEVL